MKIKISSVFDTILFFTIGFIILFVWVRYFIHDIYLVLALSLFLNVLIFMLLRFLTKKKQIKKTLTKTEQKNIENYAFSLAFMSAEARSDFFKTLFKNYQVTEENRFFIITQPQNINTELSPNTNLNNKNTASKSNNLQDKNQNQSLADDLAISNKTLFCPFALTVTPNEVVESIVFAKSIKAKKIIIYSAEIDKQIFKLVSFVSGIKIILLDKRGLYFSLLKPNETYPQVNSAVKQNNTFKQLFEFATTRNKFKNYMFSGFIILISSIFMQFNIYYVIMSTVLFLMGAICLFDKKTLPQNILD